MMTMMTTPNGARILLSMVLGGAALAAAISLSTATARAQTEPPDPCLTAACQHAGGASPFLNPQPLPPGLRHPGIAH